MTDNTKTLNANYLRLIFEQLGTDVFLNNYRKLADTFPEVVYVFDADKNKVGYVNKQFKTLLGYSDDDLINFDYDWNKIVFKDDVEKFQEELTKFSSLQDDESHTFENRLNSKAGDWRYFRTNGTVLRRNSDGKPEAILFVAQDISESLANTLELKKTKELVNETERMHKFGIYSYDVATETFNWSDGIYLLFDVDKEKHPSPNYEFYRQFILDEGNGILSSVNKHASKTDVEYENEYSIKTKNEQIKIVLDIVKVVRDDDGSVVKIFGSMRDITKERMAERELQRNIRDLATSNRELEEFAYVASHDMQEPLRKITTFSTRLKDKFSDQLGAEGKTYLERMNVAATNMRILIENLLEISRTARNEQPFEKTNIGDIIKLAMTDLELSIEEEQVNIVVKKPLPVVEAIPSLIVQLFNNLFNNAIKFNSNESPTITISSREIDKIEREHWLLPEKKFFEISVKDNGIGFEQEFGERVFQIFQRLHGKAEYPGSGIGLSICKKIVDKHNGVIYAKSEVQQGSTFYIILPEKR
jgi:PAS domain S-box-containing protein